MEGNRVRCQNVANRLKIAIIGDSGVGKTELVKSLYPGMIHMGLVYRDVAVQRYGANVDGEVIRADIWDASNQERTAEFWPWYFHDAHACILVFDVSNKSSYESLSTWYNELRRTQLFLPCFCAANKIDIPEDFKTGDYTLPLKLGVPLCFVSALDSTNVEDLFERTISAAIKFKKHAEEINYQGAVDMNTFAIGNINLC